MEDSVVQLQKTVEDVEGMEEEKICLTDVLISDNQSSSFFFTLKQHEAGTSPLLHPPALVWKCYYIASVKGDRHAIVKLPKISDLFVIHF